MQRVLFIVILSVVLIAGGVGIQARPAAAAEVPETPAVLAQGHPNCAGVNANTPSTPECDALIAARPSPNVTPLPVDFGVIAGVTFIRFSVSEVPLYNAPGGDVVEMMPAGYTYVAVRQYSGDWAEVRPGRWVSTAGTRAAQPSTFTGVQINGLDMPFAWVLWNHCAVHVPNGTRDCEGDAYLHRFELVNIYATVNISGWNWHLIGPGIWTNQQNLSIVYPNAPESVGGRWVAVNNYEQNLVAYNGGTPVMATLVSTGIENGEWDTWPGTHSVRLKIENGPMDGAHGEEDFYSLDQVPYHMYFNGLQALHGAYWHDMFGYVHSHGCVNLSITDAKWLYQNWVTEGMTVLVYDRE